MRVFALCVAVALCAGCGQPAMPAPLGSSPPGSSPGSAPITAAANPADVNPAAVARVRAELPDGYEIADLAGPVAPLSLWGFGDTWTAEPQPCGALGELPGDGALHGWSASGSGGIIHAVVVDARVGLDPALTESCGRWTVSGGHTSGAVTLTAAPAIEGATTLGMTTAAATVVEGGTETRSHADTFAAYLTDHVVYVTVVTDPGASGALLGADVASDLMVKTVAAVRGAGGPSG